MKLSIIIFTGILFLLGFTSCKQANEDQKHTGNKQDQLTISKVNGNLIANPIIYDVIIKNPDPEDTWSTEKLEKLNKETLVDFIFKAVESGKVTAYNYHTDEKMSMKEFYAMKKLEDFDKSKIGEIQFIEDWYFDEANMKMTKIVKSIMLAYEVYDQSGKVRGYKAAFRIDLN